MARKSRKNLPQPEQATVSVQFPELDEEKIPTAIYGRLSVEDDEDNEVAVDAHKGRSLFAVSAGTNGEADLGLLYDEHQNQQRDGRNHDHQQTVHAEGDPADADAVIEDRGIVSGGSVDGGDDEVFKENGRAHRRNDEVERRGVALTQRRIDQALDDDREQAAA